MTIQVQRSDAGELFAAAGGWSDEIPGLLELRGIRRLSVRVESDVSFADQLPELEMLNVSVAHPRDLRGLERLRGVKALHVALSSGRALKHSVDFSVIPKVETLGLDWLPGIGEISSPRLRRLYLSRAPGPDLRELGAMPQLETLWLHTARTIVSLAGIERYPHLRDFEAYSLPKLLSLDELVSLPGLRRVWIESCAGISDLRPLGTLHELERLGLANCGDIGSLQPIRSLANLQMVDAHGSTRILDNDLSPLLALPRLQDVGLKARKQYRPTVPEIEAALAERKQPSSQS